MPLLTMLLVWIVVVNVGSVAAFAIDKRRAVRGEWRIAEARLLALAVLGGSPGAFRARQRYRHKTRKQPFCCRLELIAMVQAGIAAGLLFAFVRV